MMGLTIHRLFLLFVLAAITTGCASTESYVFNKLLIPGQAGIEKTAEDKSPAKLSQGVRIDRSSSDKLKDGEARMVVFREEKGAGSALRLLFAIDEYAFAAVSSGDSFSLRIPAQKKINVGTAIIQETGNCVRYKSLPLEAKEKKTYYYRLEILWRDCLIEEITESVAKDLFAKGYQPVTTAYEIDWNLFFTEGLDYLPNVCFLKKDGRTFVVRYPFLRWMQRGTDMKDLLQEDLRTAADRGNAVAVSQLLAIHVDVNTPSLKDGTPLIFASKSGHVEVVRLLLDAGANINIKLQLRDAEGEAMTALGAAQKNGHKDIVALLKQYGAVE